MARNSLRTDPYIVSGTPAPKDAYPFIVSLRAKKTNDFYCGGALVSDRFVLTAAHCIHDSIKFIEVGVGSNAIENQTIHELEEAFIYPSYTPLTTIDDIALLKLKKPVTFSDSVQPILFPFPNRTDNLPVIAMGWGRTAADGPASEILLELKRNVLSNDECSNRLAVGGSKIKSNHICLGTNEGDGVCFGDSGGPMVHEKDGKFYILGVVAWGIPCALGFPDVFVRVAIYSHWINTTMKFNSGTHEYDNSK
ncbi:hypothetical protein RUM44_012118 [Polyplax serrata]|uniref:Peptidase S1 domain-containing protein n=1 Tax=Polyplax serrata TaxID=468196 RepID=A0ABR1BEA6_POLSC